MPRAKPNILYRIDLKGLCLRLGNGRELDASSALSNGRCSYLIFEELVGKLAGLEPGTQGSGSDLKDEDGNGYEMKAYMDPIIYPRKGEEFHTSASCTFPPNRHGKKIRKMLSDGRYSQVLKLCKETGYSKNEFYIYTNTSRFTLELPLKFLILPTSRVLTLISKTDPRKICRQDVLDAADEEVDVPASWIA